MKLHFLISILLFQIVTLAAFADSDQYLDTRIILEQEEAEGIIVRSYGDDFHPRKDFPEQYLKAEKIMDDLYRVAKKELATTYGNFPVKPMVFLTDYNSAIPVRTNGVLQTSNIITVNIDDINKESLYGVLAHELSHYFLDAGRIPQDDKEIGNVYLTADNPSGCIKDSFELAKKQVMTPELEELTILLHGTTLIYKEDTSGIPLDSSDGENAFKILRDMISIKYRKEQGGACEIAIDAMDTLVVDVYVKSCSTTALQRCRISPELAKVRDLAIIELKKSGPTCLEKDYPLFLSRLEEMQKITIEELKSEYFDNTETYSGLSVYQQKQLSLIFTPANPFDILVKLHTLDKDQIAEDFKKLDMKENDLRYISDEDQADILGQIIASGLPKKGLFPESRLITMNPAEIKECKDIVSAGREPSYGFLTDSHHSSCWRYWRAVKLEEELSSLENKEIIVKYLLEMNLKKVNTSSLK